MSFDEQYPLPHISFATHAEELRLLLATNIGIVSNMLSCVKFSSTTSFFINSVAIMAKASCNDIYPIIKSLITGQFGKPILQMIRCVEVYFFYLVMVLKYPEQIEIGKASGVHT